MKTPFIIYCQAVGLYALLTIPALAEPVMYFISLMYVLMYGWFAWFVFSLLYIITNNLVVVLGFKFLSLFIAVVIAVAVAYQMLETLKVEKDVWHSGYIIFPFVAVVAGWISVSLSRQRI